MVTHDQEEAMTMADRIVVMNHSEIIQIGTPEEIYENPKDAFVADFIGSINFVHDDKEDRVVAIRPEHVLLENLSVGSLQKAVISDIEFRGAFYRLTLDCNENKTLLSDVPVHDYKKLQLHKFKEVNINILENKFSYYDKIDLGLV